MIRINHNHLIYINRMGRLAMLSYLYGTPRKKGNRLPEHKFFDDTVVLYQIILETFDKILNFTRSFFQHLSRPISATEISIRLDPYVQVILLKF